MSIWPLIRIKRTGPSLFYNIFCIYATNWYPNIDEGNLFTQHFAISIMFWKVNTLIKLYRNVSLERINSICDAFIKQCH